MSTRQDWLLSQASSALMTGSMRGLYRWYSDLAPADQMLIEHFIVKPGSIPVDVAPEAEPEPEVVEEVKPKPVSGVWVCGNCGEVWKFNPGWCSECGWDGRKDDKMRLEAA